MKAVIREITGMNNAIESMFMSKRTWTPELGSEINTIYDKFQKNLITAAEYEKLQKWVNTVAKIGQKHTTLLRFIDISIMTEGMHRGGQDDIDAHAKRFESRIIRTSTRLASFGDELSDYYKDKIIPMTRMLDTLCIDVPDFIIKIRQTNTGKTYYLSHDEYLHDKDVLAEDNFYVESEWVKTANGYIRSDLKDDLDVKRGLNLMSIPSNFISKINITEWAHVYRERNASSSANPEVRQWAEMVQDELEKIFPVFNREYIGGIYQ